MNNHQKILAELTAKKLAETGRDYLLPEEREEIALQAKEQNVKDYLAKHPDAAK